LMFRAGARSSARKRHFRALSNHLKTILFFVMAGLDPRLSGLILVDEAHGMDSSAV
jgi:hypothetical protein